VDHLVIGSGIAGLTFALKLAQRGRKVLVVTKKERHDSSTNRAQGGIAAVLDPGDSFAKHIEDTLIAGAGLCHADTVRIMVEEGPARVAELIDLGVRFSRNEDRSSLSLGMEGGHSHRRIAHAADLTGAAIEEALVAACNANPNLELRANHVALELIRAPGSNGRQRCQGAILLDHPSHRVIAVLARTTLLCTGGCGRIFQRTTNPPIATGDGIAMAFRTGVPIANMEFIQFHPTALITDSADSFLISEAVRGEGGSLRTRDGERFMHRYDDREELAPRDIVARAIDSELKARHDPYVLLDVTHFPPAAFRRRFPNIHSRLLRYGIDPEREGIPVAPSAHYTCGGIITNHDGESALPGLHAAGEVACTGVHGANRLASNSLLEAVVFAHRAAVSAWRGKSPLPGLAAERTARAMLVRIETRRQQQAAADLVAELRSGVAKMMQEYVGIVRSSQRLKLVAERLSLLATDIEEMVGQSAPSVELFELQSVVTTALIIVQAAHSRRESRGLHWLEDHPEALDPPLDTIVRPDPQGGMATVEQIPAEPSWSNLQCF
jgi:L-aspartate oxidase